MFTDINQGIIDAVGPTTDDHNGFRSTVSNDEERRTVDGGVRLGDHRVGGEHGEENVVLVNAPSSYSSRKTTYVVLQKKVSEA